ALSFASSRGCSRCARCICGCDRSSYSYPRSPVVRRGGASNGSRRFTIPSITSSRDVYATEHASFFMWRARALAIIFSFSGVCPGSEFSGDLKVPLLEIVWVIRGHPDGNFQVATCSILSLSRDHPFRPAMVGHSPSRAAAVKDGALAPPVGLSLTAASAMEHLGHKWDEGIRVRVACR